MKAASILTLLACAVGLSAQAPQRGAATFSIVGPDGESTTREIAIVRPCPAAMRLDQGSSTQMIRTGHGKSSPVMTPKLTLWPQTNGSITAATVTVHGFPAVTGAIPLAVDAIPRREEISRTLMLKLKWENGGYSAELLLQGFGAVTWLDLNALTYADGSTWRWAADKRCGVAPNPLLLIGAH